MIKNFTDNTSKESLAEFTAKAIKSIEYQMAVDTYSAFATAMGALTTTGDALMKVVGFSSDAAISLAQRVSAWNGGQKTVILGTKRALQYVLPSDGNYRYQLDSDFVKLGYIRTAFGYDLMELPQLANWATPFKTVLSDSNLYFISTGVNKLLKVCTEGSTLSNVDAPFDKANLTQNATFIKYWGISVATNAIAGLMVVS